MKKPSFLILPAVIMMAACSEPKTETENDAPEDLIETPLVFDTFRVEMEWGDCANSEEGCVTVLMEYPQIRNPDSIGQLINRHFIRMILGEFHDSLENPEDYARLRVHEYELLSAGDKKYPGWQIEKLVGIAYSGNQLLSFRFDALENTGGVQAQNKLTLETWSLKSGQRIILDQVFSGNFRDSLEKLARFHLGQAMQTSLELVSTDPQNFNPDGFRLSDQFLLDENGISFLYDQRLPGAGNGLIEFTIPYTELIDYNLIDENGPLGFLLGSVNL